jgi:Flp pilus assembly pilin Flp
VAADRPGPTSKGTMTERNLIQNEQGQTMAEYGVVLAVITIAVVGVFTALSGGIQNAINNVVGLLP